MRIRVGRRSCVYCKTKMCCFLIQFSNPNKLVSSHSQAGKKEPADSLGLQFAVSAAKESVAKLSQQINAAPLLCCSSPGHRSPPGPHSSPARKGGKDHSRWLVMETNARLLQAAQGCEGIRIGKHLPIGAAEPGMQHQAWPCSLEPR